MITVELTCTTSSTAGPTTGLTMPSWPPRRSWLGTADARWRICAGSSSGRPTTQWSCSRPQVHPSDARGPDRIEFGVFLFTATQYDRDHAGGAARTQRAASPNSCALGAGHEVGLGEVDAIGLVHLDCPQQQRRIDADDRVERDQRTHGLRDLLPRGFVERLQDIHRLRRHEIGGHHLPLVAEVGARPRCHLRRVARQVTESRRSCR
jgi:hypothetical protein